jgi:hypothetical protein
MITQIVMHLMPYEIDWFEWQAKQLKIGSTYLNSKDKIIVDVTLNLNLTDWENSQIKKQFFIDKYINILQLFDWCQVISDINEDNTCLGCMDKRRTSAEKYNKIDNFIWLDCDIIFLPHTLKILLDSASILDNQYYIISPQISRLWDSSWDVLVNKHYINDKWEQNNPKDPYNTITQDYGDINLKPIPTIKFGGGWFNLISSNLLRLIKLPDSMGSYGPDDTYIMECSKLLKSKGTDIQQYITENLVIAENLKYRVNNYEKYLNPLNDRIKYREESEKIFQFEIEKFYKNN